MRLSSLVYLWLSILFIQDQSMYYFYWECCLDYLCKSSMLHSVVWKNLGSHTQLPSSDLFLYRVPSYILNLYSDTLPNYINETTYRINLSLYPFATSQSDTPGFKSFTDTWVSNQGHPSSCKCQKMCKVSSLWCFTERKLGHSSAKELLFLYLALLVVTQVYVVAYPLLSLHNEFMINFIRCVSSQFKILSLT